MTLTTREPIRRCGKPYITKDAAEHSKLALAGTHEVVPCNYGCRGWHLEKITAASVPVRTAAKDTGFPSGVKLLIRTRAGNGSPENAHCEACGIWLGFHGGQIQHIYARQSGGSAQWLYRSAANGALLCGTSETGDHGLCEARDPHMFEAGFWRKRNGQEKPGDYPVMLHGRQSGITVWLTPEGTYAFKAPGRAA